MRGAASARKRKRHKDPPPDGERKSPASLSESSDSDQISNQARISTPQNDKTLHDDRQAPPPTVYDPNGSYVVIKSHNVPFDKIGPFWIDNEIKGILGNDIFQVETPRDGTCVIKTQNSTQTKK